MLEHGKWRHISKSEVEVFKDSEVAGVEGLNNHSLQFRFHALVEAMIINLLIEQPNGFSNLECCGRVSVDGCIAGVDREIEGNIVGPDQVGSSGEQEVKMTVCSATPGGVDCACIGIEFFFEESNRRSVGLTNDGGEFLMGKRQAGA
jgi:hypothetical protein